MKTNLPFFPTTLFTDEAHSDVHDRDNTSPESGDLGDDAQISHDGLKHDAGLIASKT